MGRNVSKLPEIAYHYTALRLKKKILKEGLIPTDNYNRGDTPVVWFYCERHIIASGCLEVRVKVDRSDPNWRTDWGGDWDSIVYTGRIPPEKLEVELVRDIYKRKYARNKLST